MNLHKHQLYLL